MDNPRSDARATFPSTRWSRVIGRGAGTAARNADLELLASAYWRPVYAYIVAKWRLPHDQALDRTQDFFMQVLERDLLAKADPTRGRFRAFLKTALQNSLVDRVRAERADKRGGGKQPVSLDGADRAIEVPAGATPDAVLDARWRRDLVARALEHLEHEFDAEGKAVYFAVFRDYFVASSGGVDYRTLAERYGVSTDDVSNYLRKAKLRYRSRLRQSVLETVSNAEELEEELRWLFGQAVP